MSKYEPLQIWLRQQSRSVIPMTFHEIEKIIGSPLPASKQSRAWWSNNPSNNVMTKEWLAAGYETEQVDIAGERLVFRKKDGSQATASVRPHHQPAGLGERAQAVFENGASSMDDAKSKLAIGMQMLDDLYAAVGGLVKLPDDYDPSEPLEDWEDPVWPIESDREGRE